MSAIKGIKVLLVDDDPDLLKLLAMRLTAWGCIPTCCANGAEAIASLKQQLPSLVITDLRMEPMDGMMLFREIQNHWPNLPVVMLTAHGSIREAVEATQQGLFSFLTKPVDKRDLHNVLERALEIGASDIDTRSAADWSQGILTRSEPMLVLLEQTRLLARSDINVLINGDSGTGKELLAQALHRASRRAEKPFVAINCSAIPGELLESELFGHVKGAFTGANQDHEGLFEQASEGTLFLDEIGDMPLALQAKLLRVLQEQKLRPVGGSKDREINVRVVSATHRDVEREIATGNFREDLYYRLNVGNLVLPPLRDRKDDIPLLVKHFLAAIAERTGEPLHQLAPNSHRLLMQYHWPGNIRQLQNVVERVVALSPQRAISEALVAEALPGDAQPEMDSSATLPLSDAKKQFERDYLEQLLRKTGGNVSEAARLSGRNRSDFHKMMKRHNLESSHFKHSLNP